MVARAAGTREASDAGTLCAVPDVDVTVKVKVASSVPLVAVGRAGDAGSAMSSSGGCVVGAA